MERTSFTVSQYCRTLCVSVYLQRWCVISECRSQPLYQVWSQEAVLLVVENNSMELTVQSTGAGQGNTTEYCSMGRVLEINKTQKKKRNKS